MKNFVLVASVIIFVSVNGCKSRTSARTDTQSLYAGAEETGLATANTKMYRIFIEPKTSESWLIRSSCVIGQPVMEKNCVENEIYLRRATLYGFWQETFPEGNASGRTESILDQLKREKTRLDQKLDELAKINPNALTIPFFKKRVQQVDNLIAGLAKIEAEKQQQVEVNKKSEKEITDIELMKFLLENEDTLPLSGEEVTPGEAAGALSILRGQIDAMVEKYGVPSATLNLPYYLDAKLGNLWVAIGKDNDGIKASIQCRAFSGKVGMTFVVPGVDELNAAVSQLRDAHLVSTPDGAFTAAYWSSFVFGNKSNEQSKVWSFNQKLGAGKIYDLKEGKLNDYYSGEAGVLCVALRSNLKTPSK